MARPARIPARWAVLNLSGDYAGDTFLVVPATGAPTNPEIFLSANGPTTEAPAPVGNTDSYSWNSTTGGAWNTPSLWLDTFLGGTATVSPGSQNSVTIDSAASSFQVITGDGNSTSLTVSGLLALSGKFNTGPLFTDEFSAGVLDVLAGSTLAAATATVGGSLAACRTEFIWTG
jgi:hypothetical protein